MSAESREHMSMIAWTTSTTAGRAHIHALLQRDGHASMGNNYTAACGAYAGPHMKLADDVGEPPWCPTCNALWDGILEQRNA